MLTHYETYGNIVHMNTNESENISDYLSVKDAAEYLGVSKDTLRRWDRKGKLKAYRHPLNKYRLYRKEDLQKLLAEIKRPETEGES